MNENLAKISGGKYNTARYVDFIYKNDVKKQDENRTGREIADDIIAKTGIKLVKSNGD